MSESESGREPQPLEWRLRSIVGEDNVLVDEPMSEHTTFEVGGPADLYVIPESFDEGKADVSYDAELDSVLGKMDEKKHDLAIVLNDPSLEKIWDLSMIGKRMPKKTTFFFPKIWSGFVFYKMF